MKGIIVELYAKDAIALNKNGQFIKIPNKGNYTVGSEIDLPVKKGINLYLMTRAASIAAAFLLTAGLGYGVYSYNIPYSYIDIDINPSIELTANRYNRIIDVTALNEDGKKVLKEEGLKNKNISEGVEKILRNAREEGYLNAKAENAVMLTVSSRNEKKALDIEKNIESAAQEELKNVVPENRIVVQKVTAQMRDDAKTQDISPGKLLLIKKLQSENDSATVDEYRNSPVREIMKSIKDYKKEDIEEVNGKGQSDKEDKNNPKDDKPAKNDKEDNKNTSPSIKEQGNSSSKSNSKDATSKAGEKDQPKELKGEKDIKQQQTNDKTSDSNVKDKKNDNKDIKETDKNNNNSNSLKDKEKEKTSGNNDKGNEKGGKEK